LRLCNCKLSTVISSSCTGAFCLFSVFTSNAYWEWLWGHCSSFFRVFLTASYQIIENQHLQLEHVLSEYPPAPLDTSVSVSTLCSHEYLVLSGF
jgi:hypothetical protein